MSYIFILRRVWAIGLTSCAFLTTGETAVLFHAFRKFRNNVDLMTTRVAASYLNLAFGHVLGRVEQLTGKQPDRRRFTSAASNDLRVDREAGGALQVRVYFYSRILVPYGQLED